MAITPSWSWKKEHTTSFGENEMMYMSNIFFFHKWKFPNQTPGMSS